MNIWEVLSTVKTKDKIIIKEKYMEKLAICNPEDDAEGFKRLRAAYEEAIKYANEDEEELEGNYLLAQWLKKVESVYLQFSRRLCEQEWRALLEEEISYSLDSKEEACEKLLVFFMDNYNIPHRIWTIIDEYFNIEEKAKELYEAFPQDFINFVIDSIKYEDSLDYDLFEIDDSKDYDSWINLFFKIRRLLNNRNFEEAKLEFDSIKEFEINHRDLELLEVRYLIAMKSLKEARKICNSLMERFPEKLSVNYSAAEVEWASKNYEEAEKYYLKALEISPEDYNCKTGLADVYLEQGKLKEAEEKYYELLKVNHYDNYIRGRLTVLSEKLIEEYKIKIEAEQEDIKNKFRLAWCYYDVLKYEECIKTTLEIEAEEKEDIWQTYDLLARCHNGSGNYEKALEYLSLWLKDEIKHIDGEKDEEKKEIAKERITFIKNMKGRALVSLNRHEEALQAFNEEREYGGTEANNLDDICEVLNKLGRYEESLELCEKAIELAPNEARVYVNKAEALYNLKYYTEAMECTKNALKIYPYYSEAYLIQMKIYLVYKEFDLILEVVEEAEKLQIDDNNIKIYKAKAYRGLEQYEYAEEICNQLEININNDENKFTREMKSEVYYELASICCENNEYDKGLEYINLAVVNNNINLSNFYLRAFIYIRTNKYDLAIKDYEYTIENSNDNSFAYYQLGSIYKENGEYEKARDNFIKVLEIYPEHPDVNAELSEVYEELNDADNVLKYLSAHLEKNPSEYHYIHRGLLYFDNNMDEEALQDYEKAIELEPNSPYAYNNIGYLYQRKGEYKKAIPYYEKAIENIGDRVYLNAYSNIITSYEELNQFEKALEYYEIVMNRYPVEACYHLDKARALYKTKRYTEAIDLLKEGLNFENIKREDWYDKIASCYDKMGDFDTAINWYKKILPIDSNYNSIYEKIGIIYEKQKKNIRALFYYHKQIKINETPNVYYLLGMYYKGKGKTVRAKKYFAIALKKFEELEGTPKFDIIAKLMICYKEVGRLKEVVEKCNIKIEVKGLNDNIIQEVKL